jgi:hypothetical protein
MLTGPAEAGTESPPDRRLGVAATWRGCGKQPTAVAADGDHDAHK